MLRRHVRTRPTVWTVSEHTHPPTESALSSSTRKNFRNFGPRTVFPFLVPEGSSLKTNRRPGPSHTHQPFAARTVLTPTQTTALLNRSSESTPPRLKTSQPAPCQMCEPLALDVRHLHSSSKKSPVKKSPVRVSFRNTGKAARRNHCTSDLLINRIGTPKAKRRGTQAITCYDALHFFPFYTSSPSPWPSTINLLQWNVNSFRTPLPDLQAPVQYRSLTVICLQETRLRPSPVLRPSLLPPRRREGQWSDGCYSKGLHPQYTGHSPLQVIAVRVYLPSLCLLHFV
jgi:hypothetical protein